MKTKNSGITLIELIIVISIISMLAIAFGMGFAGWIAKYKIESQTKDIYTDLMEARLRALQRNRIHFVTLAAGQYTVREDIGPWPDGDGVITAADDVRPAGYNDPIPLLQKNLSTQRPMTWSNPADIEINFTKRGLSNKGKTLCIFSTAEPDYDCIVISLTRINMGKILTQLVDGGICDSNNCETK